NLKVLKEKIPGFDYIELIDKKVKWLQFTGDVIMYDDDSPIPFDGFSIVSASGDKDKSGKVLRHFGVTMPLIDPQKECNKRWSQTLNLLLQQGQGGYFAELGAPVDQDQWDATIKEPGETTWVNKGMIAGGGFKEKDLPVFPNAPMQVEEMSRAAMKQISGVNPDMLGLQGQRQEPGIVVKLRQQQGLTIIRRLFKSNKQMKRALYQRLISIIMKYMPEAQFKRILGENDRYVFRGNLIVDKKKGFIAPIRNLKDLKYNVNVVESASNMTKRMTELAIFMDMVSKKFPVDPKTIVKKLDLSENEKTEWIEFITKGEQQAAKNAQTQMQMKMQEIQSKLGIEKGKLQLQASKIKSETQADMAKIEQEEKDDVRNFALKLEELDREDRKMILNLVEKILGSSQGGKKMLAAGL
ncbi:MAG: hypothetical protein KKF62_19660, partial [Bacteroidetes bacterium]|nr:hypothetical protein [Bacteroidota bacterium]